MASRTSEAARDELRGQFAAEVRVAGLELSAADRERLFVMWADFIPQRAALREAAVRDDEEPFPQQIVPADGAKRGAA